MGILAIRLLTLFRSRPDRTCSRSRELLAVKLQFVGNQIRIDTTLKILFEVPLFVINKNRRQVSDTKKDREEELRIPRHSNFRIVGNLIILIKVNHVSIGQIGNHDDLRVFEFIYVLK